MNKDEITQYYNDLALAGKKARHNEDDEDVDNEEDLVGGEGAK